MALIWKLGPLQVDPQSSSSNLLDNRHLVKQARERRVLTRLLDACRLPSSKKEFWTFSNGAILPKHDLTHELRYEHAV